MTIQKPIYAEDGCLGVFDDGEGESALGLETEELRAEKNRTSNSYYVGCEEGEDGSAYYGDPDSSDFFTT
jgi:hypothetical protein